MLFQSLGIYMNMDLKIITGSGQCYVQAVHQDEHAVGVLKKKHFLWTNWRQEKMQVF